MKFSDLPANSPWFHSEETRAFGNWVADQRRLLLDGAIAATRNDNKVEARRCVAKYDALGSVLNMLEAPKK